MDEGVGGSSGLDSGPGDLEAGFVAYCARGPVGFTGVPDSPMLSVMVAKSPPVFERFIKPDSKPPFGSEVDRKGDMLGFRVTFLAGPMSDSDELVASAACGLSNRRGWIELLLLKDGNSAFSSTRFLEKKELFEAVIGVVGVFGICLERGGLMFRSGCGCFCSCRAAILAAVGVLRGPTVIGGNRRGNSFVLVCDTPIDLSVSFDELG
jgi:hypothetical protein